MGLSERQENHLIKLNRNQKGSNNRNWKGDKASYTAIHLYIRAHLKRPENCSKCNKNKSREVANLDGKYSRDLSTWIWLCRSCHLIMDNVAQKAWATKKNYKFARKV